MKFFCALIAIICSAHIGAETFDNNSEGSLERGRIVFFQCRTCHYVEKNYGHHNGPNLYGVFGRIAGTAAGFSYYSDAMKNAGKAGFIWSPALLDIWLANPRTMIPGTAMVVFDLSAQQRADLIEYLQAFHD